MSAANAKSELALLMKRATSHFISGREPHVDWFCRVRKDKDVTLCVRITKRDRDMIVRALMKRAAQP